jgi:hypothetical protein
MTGTPIRSAGTLMYISPSPGAAATVPINGLMDIGEIGVSRKDIDTTALSDKWRKSAKGLLDVGKIALSGHYYPDDRGQQILKQAVIMDVPYNFALVYPNSLGTNGTTDQFSAQVTDYKPGPGKIDGIAEFKANLSGVGPVLTTAAA